MKKRVIFFLFVVFICMGICSCKKKDSSTTPTSTNITIKAVAAGGAHSFVLKTNGTLWATGLNEDGELGTGNNTDRNSWTQVLDGVIAIAAGGFHSLALKPDGTLWVTGRNDYGELGTGDNTDRNSWTQVLP
ncbi:MAG: hypothetical protein KA120_03715 [Candidatus Goldbacteria bacterium]|nr:hypothetical protein [Candidatus Goldiibacteriota bacterium]